MCAESSSHLSSNYSSKSFLSVFLFDVSAHELTPLLVTLKTICAIFFAQYFDWMESFEDWNGNRGNTHSTLTGAPPEETDFHPPGPPHHFWKAIEKSRHSPQSFTNVSGEAHDSDRHRRAAEVLGSYRIQNPTITRKWTKSCFSVIHELFLSLLRSARVAVLMDTDPHQCVCVCVCQLPSHCLLSRCGSLAPQETKRQDSTYGSYWHTFLPLTPL